MTDLIQRLVAAIVAEAPQKKPNCKTLAFLVGEKAISGEQRDQAWSAYKNQITEAAVNSDNEGQILVKTIAGVAFFRRGGIGFNAQPSLLNVADLTGDQYTAIKKEKNLVVIRGRTVDGQFVECD